MASRVEKYHTEDFDYEAASSASSRSDRNAKLYRQVYGKYNDLDNLPLEDNTDEIDMDKLKELLVSYNQKKEDKEIKENLNILEQRKRKIDEQKVYDINKILEKAKYENSKLKEASVNDTKPDLRILSTLGSAELSLEDIRQASKEYSVGESISVSSPSESEEKLSMTRELKYQKLNQPELLNDLPASEQNDLSTKELSLDLFEDLKPTGNTIVTKPVNDNEVEIKQVESDFRSTDTSDIDVIKDHENTSENDFFTSSYHFSKNDFADDDFFEPKKKGGLFKIILLILAITVFVGVILYFVGTYGLGI